MPHEPLSASDIELMRAELPGLTTEIVRHIRNEIPDYNRPMDARYDENMELLISLALTSYVDRLTGEPGPQHLIETFTWLGKLEAREGRALDSALRACHLACTLALRRLTAVGERAGWSPSLRARLADTAMAFADDLCRWTQMGFQAEQARSAGQHQLRQELLATIVSWPAPPAVLVAERAARLGWPVPGQVTVVALALRPGTTAPEPGPDMLAQRENLRHFVLVPGEPDDGKLALVLPAAGDYRAAIGPTLPLALAHQSLITARRALDLGQQGFFGEQVIRCSGRLRELAILGNETVAEVLMRQELSALTPLSARSQAIYMETLEALTDSGAVIGRAAARIGLHLQGMRDRVRRLQPILGDFLADPERWFFLQLAVRVWRMKGRPIPITPPPVPPAAQAAAPDPGHPGIELSARGS